MTMLFNPARMLFEELAAASEPPAAVDYLLFAKEHIVFSQRISNLPGRYQESKFPFFSEILRALSPEDPCTIVTLAKSAQVGGTVLANIFLLGTTALSPCDFLYVHPTEENASRWSKQKLMPLIRETEAVQGLFSENSRDGFNSVLYKERKDGRGALQAAGANSPAGLSMISPRRQVQDDLAKWNMNEAGDPENQADSRSKAFFDRKIFKISTPMVSPGCRITANFKDGTQERYHVPCPHCHELQVLEWENMRDHLDPEHPENAHFCCVKCGCEIHEHHRAWMVKPENGARWIAKHPERARHHRSFHIWVAYSPLESWEAIARAWFKVQSGGPDDKEKAAEGEQVFFNDWLGEAFEADNRAIPWEDLRDRANTDGFPLGIVPAEALMLTLGIDVQGDRVEWLLRGWGRNHYSAVIDRGIINSSAGAGGKDARDHTGHISEPEVMAELDKLMVRQWKDVNGKRRSIGLTAIDGNAYTEDVWFWAKRHPRSRVIMVRGGNQESAPMLVHVKEYDKRGKPKKQKWSSRFYTFNASSMKVRLYRDMKKTEPETHGYIRFAIGLGDDFFQQVTSEVRVSKKTKTGYQAWAWTLPSGRNEALDMMNQARAAAYRLGVPYWSEEKWDELADEISKLEVPEQSDIEDLLTGLVAVAKAVADAAPPTPPNPTSDRVAAALARAQRAAHRKQ